LTPREQELHAVIRSITENTLHPLNTTILAWLKEDDFFRAAIGRPVDRAPWLRSYRGWRPTCCSG
jgi:hypothetical protein